MADRVESLCATVEAVLPEALQGVYRERQKKQTDATRAVAHAKKAHEKAERMVRQASAGTTMVVSAPGAQTTPVSGGGESLATLLPSVRARYLALLTEPAIIQAVREVLTDSKNRNLPALLRSVMEFVGGEERPTGTVNVTLVSRIPRPDKAIDITPETRPCDDG